MVLKNKKGMLFTFTVIALLTLFLASYGIHSVIEDRGPINKRITTMNNFIFSLEQDLSRKLYISGFRTIFLMEKQITQTGEYITNFDSDFEDAFFNGTMFNEPQELLNKMKFQDIEDSLNQKASKININISLLNPKIYVIQEDPWHVKFILSSNLIVQDKTNLASWNITKNISASIPIENFEDPLYIVNTNGLVVNKINKTIYSTFGVTNLTNHLENSYYINSTLAPSFLDRLKGINLANENGIESLVYLPDLSSQGILVENKSVVDYIYFSANDPVGGQVIGMPIWFILDNAHQSIYS